MSQRRRERRRLSLRVRITAGAVLVVALALVVAGQVVLRALEREMTDQVDASLTSTADYIDRAMTSGSGLPAGEGPNDLYVQFLSRDGEVLGASDAAQGVPALAEPVRRRAPSRIQDAVTSPFGRLRVLTQPSPTDPRITLVVAKSSAEVADVRHSLERLLVAMTVGLTLFLGVLVWIVVGRALRPVDAMARTVDAIGDRDLADRVVRPRTGDELDRLADTLNDLLGRLETALARERRFVSDASHELRTPITGIRGLLASEPEDLAAVRRSRAEALAAVDALDQLVDELLTLARAEDGEREPPAPVDLDELVLTQAGKLEHDTALRVDTSAVSGGQVLGIDSALGRMIENLAANAARHARTTVSFGLRQHDADVELTVADDGPGIAEADRARVFERFTTLDDSRAGERTGTGLGLAIVAAIVEAHHGSVEVDDADERVAAGNGSTDHEGARFTVRLPAAAATRP